MRAYATISGLIQPRPAVLSLPRECGFIFPNRKGNRLMTDLSLRW